MAAFGAEGCRILGGGGVMKPRGTMGRDGDVRQSVEIVDSVANDVRDESHVRRIEVGGFFWRIPRPGSGQAGAVIYIPRPGIFLGGDAPEAKVSHPNSNRVNVIGLVPNPSP